MSSGQRPNISMSAKKKPRPRETIEVVKNPDQVSQKIGYVVDEFKCCHNNFQGIIYAGPLAVVFLGRILLFEWTVVIKWDDVVKVQKCSEKGYENAIRIETRGKNASKYLFERFFDSSTALGILVSLHNDSILDLTQKVMPTPKIMSRGLRRNNSDPLRISNLFNFDDEMFALQQNEELVENIRSMKDEATCKPPLTGDEFKRVSAASAPPQRNNFNRSNTYNYTIETSQRLHVPEGESVNENEEAGEKNNKKENKLKQTEKKSAAAMQQEWSQVLNDTKSYSETAIQNLELACTLDDFVKSFVENDAKYSIHKFMADNGDQDIQVSEWKVDDDEYNSKSRTIEYTHPVNAPMAPPMARARKEQLLQRYGDHGLVFETKTYVADVPMTDCFYVADQVVRVQSTCGKGGENSVLVSMLFDIRFVKSTMFKSIISRTTKSELEKFFNELADYLSQNIGQPSASPVSRPTSLAGPGPIQLGPNTSKWSQVAVTLLVGVLCLQIWIVLEMKAIHEDLQQLQLEQILKSVEQSSSSQSCDPESTLLA